MQLDEFSASLACIKYLTLNVEYLFDLSLDEPRLRPVLFESHSNITYERNYHSFVDEAACGRWAIATYRTYLWDTKFYWLCDYSAIKEVLQRNGSIH